VGHYSATLCLTNVLRVSLGSALCTVSVSHTELQTPRIDPFKLQSPDRTAKVSAIS
jgi:hypothetical protein